MSLDGQDFGFDPTNLFVAGKFFPVQFVIPGLTISDVASAEWGLFRFSPEEQPVQTAVVLKAISAGLTLTDSTDGLQVLVTIDPADTSALEGGVYFHRLDYVETTGEARESARGRAKLTPRV